MAKANITLRPLDANDIRQTANIHRLAFPESAWTKLGKTVVEEYYRWHFLGPHPIVRAVGAFVEDRLAGFCVSGVFNASTSGFLSRNRGLLAKRLAMRPWLVIDPAFAGKIRSGLGILRRFDKKRRRSNGNGPSTPINSFGVLSIAVDPSCQGLGIGEILMDDAQKAAAEAHFAKMDLTVNPSNGGGIRFYERLGWTKSYHEDGWKGVMIKELKP